MATMALPFFTIRTNSRAKMILSNKPTWLGTLIQVRATHVCVEKSFVHCCYCLLHSILSSNTQANLLSFGCTMDVIIYPIVLYPDITRMVNEEQGESYIPCDVYGRETPIPSSNLFVAGTSCKNFSMLRSKFRIDIENKGCSGETFLAAVEVLFAKKPPMAIFENVKNAPWVRVCRIYLV